MKYTVTFFYEQTCDVMMIPDIRKRSGPGYPQNDLKSLRMGRKETVFGYDAHGIGQNNMIENGVYYGD